MNWYLLTLLPDEAAAGVLARVKEDFTAAFRAAGGPRTMALFRRESEEGVELFFTPECTRHARELLERYGAAPCASPSLLGLELLVGHNEITYYLTT
ncbi:hypothetical protein [Geomonas oryzae]|uniref:hypothetical protein n=1 Tax=Geomonas oryzae TaxID=2364273 RepID=UPI00100A3965|nr:hypothetical protein [Geomonas oryzae]